MPEHRARKHHQDRVAEALREEIGTMIEGELSDPRIDFCYVTEVVLNPGGKSARVYVAVDSSVKDLDKAEENTIAGLDAAKGYIRHDFYVQQIWNEFHDVLAERWGPGMQQLVGDLSAHPAGPARPARAAPGRRTAAHQRQRGHPA